MRMVLTSGGVSTPLLRSTLVDLLGRPLEECDALCIPTASYGHPWTTPVNAWRFVTGTTPAPMVELGWRSVGLLELAALPSLARERWVPWVEAADVLLVDGGDALYLAHWMRESGLVDLLPDLPRVGLSAGTMVMAPQVGEEFVGWPPPDGADRALGIIDVAVFPHIDNPDLPENTMAAAERWAAALDGPAYALDDRSALVVDGGPPRVVSDGTWRFFPGPGAGTA